MANDTIYALATPPGRGAVAIVRISGAGTDEALRAFGLKKLPAPRVATLVKLYKRHSDESGTHAYGANDPDWRKKDALRSNYNLQNKIELKVVKSNYELELIDNAMVIKFPSPQSYTGEDMAELHLHGGRAVVKAVVETLSSLPSFRSAEPGEFTRRAYLNGKMDLTMAEAVADIVEAETPAQLRQSLRHLTGKAAKETEQLRADVLHALALQEAYLDFPDEEIPEQTLRDVAHEIERLGSRISALLADERVGERIREGIFIAIIGAPNAGKSSLLNALAGRDAAIVSEKAGTTRDVIEVHLNLRGYPVILADTAGLRESDDAIESEGIARARKTAEQADLRLLVLDATTSNSDKPPYIVGKNDIIILNKVDLLPSTPQGHALPVSVKTGKNMDQLTTALSLKVESMLSSGVDPLITRARHREAFSRAHQALERWKMAPSLDLQCEELRHAARAIGSVTGKIGTEEMLDVIFREFCIGK